MSKHIDHYQDRDDLYRQYKQDTRPKIMNKHNYEHMHKDKSNWTNTMWQKTLKHQKAKCGEYHIETNNIQNTSRKTSARHNMVQEKETNSQN